MAGYVRPVNPTNGRMSTWLAHTRRVPPSSEAGVDYYCPIGTPIRAAAAGRIYDRGGSIYPATGRFITIDLDDGRRVRYLHLSRWASKPSGQRVKRGEVVGYAGASGYGSEYFGASSLSRIPANTGGPHVHATLWAGHFYRYGRAAGTTLDLERYIDSGYLTGSGPYEEDELSAKAESQIDDIWDSVRRGVAGKRTEGKTTAWIRSIKSNTEAIRAAQAANTAAIKALAASVGADPQVIADTVAAAVANVTVESTLSAEQVARIAADVAAATGEPDYDAIAKAVNDEAAARLAE